MTETTLRGARFHLTIGDWLDERFKNNWTAIPISSQ